MGRPTFCIVQTLSLWFSLQISYGQIASADSTQNLTQGKWFTCGSDNKPTDKFSCDRHYVVYIFSKNGKLKCYNVSPKTDEIDYTAKAKPLKWALTGSSLTIDWNGPSKTSVLHRSIFLNLTWLNHDKFYCEYIGDKGQTTYECFERKK
jgi:hypothetical protein